VISPGQFPQLLPAMLGENVTLETCLLLAAKRAGPFPFGMEERQQFQFRLVVGVGTEGQEGSGASCNPTRFGGSLGQNGRCLNVYFGRPALG
jgi:hypothetical protein